MPDNKGGWHRLDNTANLFPVITSRRFSNVYRIAVTLDAAVEPELLQRALIEVLPEFAAFRVRLRRGLFWHYFETNPNEPILYLEDDYPCRYIDPGQNRHFLFRLSYYENRVNLEVFHVLTDGTAGKDFLLAVVCRYLMLAHPAEYSEDDKARKWFSGHASNVEDGYLTNYTPSKKSNYRVGRGYKIKGERNLLGNLSVVHVHLGIDQLKTHCKQRQVTITQYLTAVIGWAVCTQQRKASTRLPVNIFLPVNLRNMFDSGTALNFFSNVYISFEGDLSALTFEEILQEVKSQFEEKISKEGMLEKISYTTAQRSNPVVRVIPLLLKNAVLRLVFEMSAKSSTLSFTNLGPLRLPPQFERHVTGATLLLSCAPKEPFKCAAISYKNDFTLNMSSTLRSVALQRAIVRHLAEDGLHVVVETNGVDYASM
ncbi:hypothetical protein LJC49_04125 [Ruminococcaceae bacterium OttesenSCG-928-I18]|nr:hypothetical protein [Ruminococcaceae bacterium OttesenSCG-928-I18]